MTSAVINPETGDPYAPPPILDWEEWYNDMDRGHHAWNESEHYTLIGMTGCGKTTLAAELLKLQPYVTALVTKPGDDNLKRISKDYHLMREYKDLNVRKYPRRMIWPKLEDLNRDQAWQKYHVECALDGMFSQGGWTIYLDEVRYLSDELGLRRKLNLYLLQYRAMGGSLLAATQRPSWIPREFYSQATHMCFWKQTDEYDLGRIAGIGSFNARFIRYVVSKLGPHQFLYLHVPTGYMAISQAPNPDKSGRR